MMVAVLVAMKMMAHLNNFDSHKEGEGESGDDHQDGGDREEVGEDPRALLASWII